MVAEIAFAAEPATGCKPVPRFRPRCHTRQAPPPRAVGYAGIVEQVRIKLGILAELGYIDSSGTVTDRGRFAMAVFGHDLEIAEVVGSGALEDELKLLVDPLGLTNRVLLPGFEPNPAAWISRARVYVLPSVWEGFPNSLLEALAIGIPVVASDCRSGPRELLVPDSDPTRKTDGIEATPYGYLVPAPDDRRLAPSEPPTRQELMMAEAIERTLRDTDSSSRQAEAARRRADEFAPEKIFPDWLEVLRPPG